jgi:hypothetical protein
MTSRPLHLKLPLAQRSALKQILREGPFLVYVTRGFTGFAEPHVTIYGPKGLSRQTFERLKRRDYLRRLGQDDFKELWDISGNGVDAIAEADAEVAQIEPSFVKRRLSVPYEIYGYDKIRLITRVANPTGPSCRQRRAEHSLSW